MNLTELISSENFQVPYKFLKRWSVALAILGGIFILNGWPYANIITSIAGFILVVAFFLSAFAPLHDVLDWTLVFPELAADEEKLHKYRKRTSIEGTSTDEGYDTFTSLNETRALKKEIELLKQK